MTHIDYTAKDFLSLRDQMIKTAQDRLPEWSPTGSADFALALIEATAYMGDVLAYYTDRALNEAFLSTAAQRSSVIDIARMLGYEPQGPVPATVDLSFAVDNETEDVTIPEGTRVTTSVPGSTQNLTFETDEEVVVTVGSPSTVEVPATEGVSVLEEALGSATTDAFQRFDLARSPVVADSVVVEVDEGGGYQRWVYYEHLLEADSSTPAYTLTRDAGGNVEIRFGDDVDGRIPAHGSPIRASYRVGGGEHGNVPVKTITNLLDAVEGVVSVQNLSEASGGEDAERVEEIRRNAPLAKRTGDRAVTLRDFGDLASVVPGVAYASAESDNATSVIVYVAPKGVGQPALSSALQASVEEALSTRVLLGTSTTVLGPTYVPLDVAMTVHVDDAYSQSEVVTRVERAVDDLYSLPNVDFGQTLPLSELYREVSDVEGVLYLQVTQHERDYDGSSTAVVTDEVTHTVGELPFLNLATITPQGGITT